MLHLPASLREITGLPGEATVQDLLNYLENENNHVLDGLLSSEASLAIAASSMERFSRYQLRIEDQVGVIQYKFCNVNFKDHPDPILVGLIPREHFDAPPTELENLIFWAIIDDRLQEQKLNSRDPSRNCIDWRSLAGGKAIIAEPIDLKLGAADQQVISALFGLTYPCMPSADLPNALVHSAAVVKMDKQPRTYTEIQALLLHEASIVQRPKWRFLSLYRILENAYLANIKDTLIKEYDQDASKAIKSADEKLANEPNQLVSLAEGIDAIAEFEAFNTAMETLIATHNKYIIKLDRAAENEKLYKSQDKYKKAVIRFYKIRCSIAHAGTSSVIYEMFPDANSAILELLPHVEAIALKSLKIVAS
ncbi:MAG: hypothetical protein HYZ31_12840 [Gammaproteobacteria bacterium]|nr:hypothetical protein [Gammaproteobacteria bacterium]